MNGISGRDGAGLAREAIEAALRKQTAALQKMQNQAAQLSGSDVAGREAQGFTEALRSGVEQVDQAAKAVDNLHLEVVQGKLDFHEVAAQLKQSELSFTFALEVRNKFIDAYREIMRMSV